MRNMIVAVAGLGFDDATRHGLNGIAGPDFQPVESVFPAVTCVAQASFRTASLPKVHGMVSNGRYDRINMRSSFWEQSSRLVSGERIWDRARADGRTVGIYFWQQSLGESADFIVSPAPIHKHSGGMIMENYTKPSSLAALVSAKYGKFPLHRYWGPLASSKVGRNVVRTVRLVLDEFPDQDNVFVYLPTLDYDLQRFGPEDARCAASFAELGSQLGELRRVAESAGAEFTVFGDYAITQVSLPVAAPNVLLRRAGFFLIRSINGMAYPDFYESRAFAMADHEIAHVYVKDAADIDRVSDILSASGEYDLIEARDERSDWGGDNAGEILIAARQGSWCDYRWWTDKREAPEFAAHVDIHNKPGYDPCELFFDRSFLPATCRDASRIRGTHGRRCKVAFASTAVKGTPDNLVQAASELSEYL